MFKVLVLQRLHSLADDATSFQITDRDSFRTFLGLTPADLVPDGQTIHDFRQTLIKQNTIEPLFEVFLDHLQQKHGLALAKAEVILDASFVEVPKQRNTREQNAQIKAGEVPQEFIDKPKLGAHKDTDARWTKKDFKTFYGYKNHIKVDVKTKLILKSTVTAAQVHDSQAVEDLVSPEDIVLYADSAYTGAPIAEQLEALGIEAKINEKGSKTTSLTDEQKASNRSKSKVRARVEHRFGYMTVSMHAMYQRSIGYARNAAGIGLTNLVYNRMRFEQIQRLSLA